MHTFLWVRRLFPDQFKNFLFLGVGEVDARSFAGEEALRSLRETIESSLRYYVSFCYRHGLAAEYRMGFGTYAVEEFPP